MTVLWGELISNAYPFPLTDDGEASSEAMDIEIVSTGTLLWPSIGWDCPILFGVPRTADLSYVDPFIPPPMNALIFNTTSLDDVLFCNTSR